MTWKGQGKELLLLQEYLWLFSPAPCPGVQGEEEKVLLFEHGIHIALFQGKAAQLLAKVLLGCLQQPASDCTSGSESTRHLERAEFGTSVSCKCSGKHAQGFIKTPNT